MKKRGVILFISIVLVVIIVGGALVVFVYKLPLGVCSPSRRDPGEPTAAVYRHQ